MRELDTGKGEGVENSDSFADIICTSPPTRLVHAWMGRAFWREGGSDGGLRSVIGERDKRGEHAHRGMPAMEKVANIVHPIGRARTAFGSSVAAKRATAKSA